MRRLLLLVLIAGIFSSCSSSYRPYLSDEYLTALAFPPTESNIDIFIKGESMPGQPYIRLALLREQTTLSTNSSNELLDRLKRRSTALGADGLLLLDGSSFERVATDVITEDTYSVSQETMMAVAIKYQDNVRYQEGILTSATVEPALADEAPMGGRLLFLPSGEIDSYEGGWYAKYAHDYSLHLLWEKQLGWEYKVLPDPYEKYAGGLIRRQERGRQNVIHKVNAFLLDENQPALLKVRRLNGLEKAVSMEISYDDQGRIASRKWRVSNYGEIHVTPHYDEDGLLSREVYRHTPLNGVEETWFTVRYQYMSRDEWQEIAQREQVIEPGR